MEKDVIALRKEKIFTFFKQNPSLISYVLLFLILLLTVFLRSQFIDNLVDPTTGNYISLELDSTIYLKYARSIVEHGTLFDVDPERYVPLGAPVRDIGIFTSYFIAYLYKFLHLFIPSITLEYVDIIYPIIAIVIMTIFFFLILRRIFDYRIALLSCLLINLLPPFLFRSISSDHDILVMMLFMIAFYFYIVSLHSKKLFNIVSFGLLSGVFTFLSRFTGGAANILLGLFGLTVLFSFIINNFKDKYLYSYLAWVFSFSFLVFIFNLNGGLSGYINSITTLPAYFGLLVILIYLLFFKYDVFKLHKFKVYTSLKEKFPIGLTTIFISGFLSCILGLLFFGPNFFLHKFTGIFNLLFHNFSLNRIDVTVAENKRTYVIDWISQFGWFYFLAFFSGVLALFYALVKKLNMRKLLTTSFSLFFFFFIFSSYAENAFFNGQNFISKLALYGSVILFSSLILYLYFNSFYKKLEDYTLISEVRYEFLLILTWVLFMTFAATGGIRLLFEFSPVTAIAASYFIFYLFDYLWTIKLDILKYALVVLLILILFSPFSFFPGFVHTYFQSSYGQLNYIGPGYNRQWQMAGEWVRNSTPSGSVFAHWWDYGYWVQEGFQRPTMLDGGNFYGWWNYLMAREVLTAQNLTQPFKYLYTHNASYLLIISDDIGKYPAYSLIGSDERLDRNSYLPSFGLDPTNSKETRNSTLLFYRGSFGLDEDFIYKGKVYPTGSAGIAGIILPFSKLGEENTTSFTVGQPKAILVSGSTQIELSLKCVYIDKLYTFANYTYEGCFRIIPVFSGDQSNKFGAGMFISRKVVNSLLTKLFLFNEHSDNYELVYDDSTSIPLAVYNGRQIGPLKIWKIHYPKNLTLTDKEKEYYLRGDYPDKNLQLLKT